MLLIYTSIGVIFLQCLLSIVVKKNTSLSYSRYVAGPDGSFVSPGTCHLEVPDSNPGRVDILYLRHGAAYCTVHYKEPSKSFEISIGHNQNHM